MTNYICRNITCKRVMNPNELLSGTRIRCVHCGSRTLQKARPEIIRKIRAR
ncbi:MAG: DNA-directed RNA polymerase subunit P [Candidatus Heimdallarchaeota archaeon]|nr:DNA-directed RNA polymerase subunit P [Candidatus Heimdallarchaeota archaeon]